MLQVLSDLILPPCCECCLCDDTQFYMLNSDLSIELHIHLHGLSPCLTVLLRCLIVLSNVTYPKHNPWLLLFPDFPIPLMAVDCSSQKHIILDSSLSLTVYIQATSLLAILSHIHLLSFISISITPIKDSSFSCLNWSHNLLTSLYVSILNPLSSILNTITRGIF